MNQTGIRILIALGLMAAVGLGWQVVGSLANGGSDARSGRQKPAPVEVAQIERGSIALRRTFSGSLEALAQFDVSPKVGGRIERVAVDVGDPVTMGQVVAELDNDEFVQEVALAEAELAVARANVAEARSRAETAQRTLDRTTALSKRGVASDSQLDAARTDQQAADASLQVAEAQVKRAEAALATAKIRMGYTTVTASWVEGDEQRVVSHRFVDPGDTVSANTPLLSIVEIDPIQAVVSVTEKDYGRLAPGMSAELATDAYPGRAFEARAVRISPVFQEASRQARVELLAANSDQALKPGMFIRATMVLDRAENVLIVPEAALTRRGDEDGVFVVSEDGAQVAWQPVKVGIRDGGRVQIAIEGGLGKRVVTLGQQLLDHGSPIVIRQPGAPEGGAAE